MKSIKHMIGEPKSFPIAADSITELHAARLLLLLKNCGINGKIEGLTKLAKLDFFVRYPDFFDRISQYLGNGVRSATATIESAMVRHHYGPWDKRYYHVLPYLKARGLITIYKQGRVYIFELKKTGKEIASTLEKNPIFSEQIEQMKFVKKLLGRKKGTKIKSLIYEAFKEEVEEKALGEFIS